MVFSVTLYILLLQKMILSQKMYLVNLVLKKVFVNAVKDVAIMGQLLNYFTRYFCSYSYFLYKKGKINLEVYKSICQDVMRRT